MRHSEWIVRGLIERAVVDTADVAYWGASRALTECESRRLGSSGVDADTPGVGGRGGATPHVRHWCGAWGVEGAGEAR